MFNEHSFFPSLSASENQTPMTTDTHRVPAAAQVLAEIHCRATSFICSCSPDRCTCTAEGKTQAWCKQTSTSHTLFCLYFTLKKKWWDFLFFVFTHCLKGMIQYLVDHRTIVTLKVFFFEVQCRTHKFKMYSSTEFSMAPFHCTTAYRKLSSDTLPIKITTTSSTGTSTKRTLPREKTIG